MSIIRQAALRARFQHAPESAWATHLAWTETTGADIADPFRGTVHVSLADRKLAFALDDGVGGPHDQPAPGELFCAALAACVDATVRLAAARMKVDIARLAVIVTGDVDSRGSLGEDGVPVGFQSMRLEIQLELADGARAGAAERLLAAAERWSEVLQTLRSRVPIVVVHAGGAQQPAAAAACG
jgi:uncharacterized OsmC-like protein